MLNSRGVWMPAAFIAFTAARYMRPYWTGLAMLPFRYISYAVLGLNKKRLVCSSETTLAAHALGSIWLSGVLSLTLPTIASTWKPSLSDWESVFELIPIST